MVNRYSRMTVVTLTDRPKSVHNRYEIEYFGGVHVLLRLNHCFKLLVIGTGFISRERICGFVVQKQRLNYFTYVCNKHICNSLDVPELHSRVCTTINSTQFLGAAVVE